MLLDVVVISHSEVKHWISPCWVYWKPELVGGMFVVVRYSTIEAVNK